MHYDAVCSALLLCPDLTAAAQPYERLGLRLSAGIDERVLAVGQPETSFTLRFLAVADDRSPAALPVRLAPFLDRGLSAVALQVADVVSAVAELTARGAPASFVASVAGEPAAWLGVRGLAGTDIVLVQRTGLRPAEPEHAFGLRRLDHLAAVTPDLEAKTRFWTDVLGVPVAGEVVSPTLVIRQFRIGDAVLELLGPASADSPIHKREPGLVSMASWEVADLDAAVQQARSAGFTVPDPAAGVLPRTRVATIPGVELAGVTADAAICVSCAAF